MVKGALFLSISTTMQKGILFLPKTILSSSRCVVIKVVMPNNQHKNIGFFGCHLLVAPISFLTFVRKGI